MHSNPRLNSALAELAEFSALDRKPTGRDNYNADVDDDIDYANTRTDSSVPPLEAHHVNTNQVLEAFQRARSKLQQLSANSLLASVEDSERVPVHA